MKMFKDEIIQKSIADQRLAVSHMQLFFAIIIRYLGKMVTGQNKHQEGFK